MIISKELCNDISTELNTAINAVFAKHGLMRKKFTSGYGDRYSLSVTAEAIALGDNGVNTASSEARAYEMFYATYELPAGILGKKFSIKGVNYAFAGIATSRRKYPIYALNLSTGSYVFFQDTVKRLLVSS